MPVLLERTAELLDPALSRPAAVHVDGTLGLGGHAEHVLRRHPGLRLIGMDRDPAALAAARERLRPYEERTVLVHARYDEIAGALRSAGLPAAASVDGILLDLGVSSMQLDEPDRGFAYSVDAPLDMRMDTTTGPTAAEVLNTYSRGDLARILKTFGEERFAGKIADRIVRRRAERPWSGSAELVELLYDTIPAATRRRGGHPAKRTFQALRIEVNGELESLRAALPAALRALRVGGRIVVLAYHSLEDRVVKDALRTASASGTPVDLPMELPGHEPEFRLVVRGSESAGETELEENPRAASVRLRAAERVRAGSEKGCGA